MNSAIICVVYYQAVSLLPCEVPVIRPGALFCLEYRINKLLKARHGEKHEQNTISLTRIHSFLFTAAPGEADTFP